LEGKSKGYAFIEYEHKSEFSNAYKRGDRERIDDKIVYTDFERGRTEKGFKPRRFGGHYPYETRPLPTWLQKDLKNFKENHPDVIDQIKNKYSSTHYGSNKHDNENGKDNKDLNFEIYENNGISKSKSKEREHREKERGKEKKHRSRSRSRSRDKRKKRNLSLTPKKERHHNEKEIDNQEQLEENLITNPNNIQNRDNIDGAEIQDYIKGYNQEFGGKLL